MTTTLSTAGLGASLVSALAQNGLSGQLVEAPALRAVLGQPLLLIRMPLSAAAGVEVTVVVAEQPADQSADRLVQDLAQVTAEVLGELVAGDASLEVAESIEPVLAAFAAPAQGVLVDRPGGPAGAVLFAVDRRAADAAGAAVGAPATGPAGIPVLPPVTGGGAGGATLQLLRDVQLAVSVELGRTELTVADVLELAVGSVVELDRAARAPVDIRVNGTLLARGEVVVVDDEYAVRVTEIIDPVA